MQSQAEQAEYVLRTAEERRIRSIQLWFTDVLGTPKSFSITPAELENALLEGMTFDGSAIDGFSRVQESDVLARPDPTTFQLLPWHGETQVARVVCDIFNLDGTPFEGCPRHALRRSLDRARERGFTFFAAPEIEYFYFDPVRSGGGGPEPLDSGSYFELTATDRGSEIRQQTVLMLEEMGIPVEHAQHEDAPSQHEIDLRYTDALTMADTVMTVRLAAKELARARGALASFMPKPLAGVQGSGMHTHLSLFRAETNAFMSPGSASGLSETGEHFVAGLLEHAGAITAVTNQWVNSYKRLVVGYEAPVHVSWARNNRSALVRVPIAKSTKPESTRVEYRATDSACNPYLAFAVILAAGMDGIERRLALPAESQVNLFETPSAADARAGLSLLPTSLDEALSRMEASTLVRETLGEHVFEWFLRNKRTEWAAYRAQVTPFEIDRYLPLL